MSVKQIQTVKTMMNIDYCNKHNISQVDDNITNNRDIDYTDKSSQNCVFQPKSSLNKLR